MNIDAHERPDVAVTLTEAEASELVGDDIAFWMGNPFLDAEMRTGKVLWWLGKVRAELHAGERYGLQAGERAIFAEARLAAVQALAVQQPPRDLTPGERRGWALAMEHVDAAVGAS